ncbi:MAG: cyclic nucleotide-binding domain-containing protein [Pseudomonadales bacterium]
MPGKKPPCIPSGTSSENINAPSQAVDTSNTTALFKGLSEENLQSLLSNSTVRSIESGREIVQHGDEVKHLYVIIEGSVKTLRASAEGEEATIRMLTAGDTFMDAVIFMGGTSPIRATAIKQSKLLMIPAHIIRQQVLRDGQLGENLLKIVSGHYKNAMQQIDSIVTKTPVERLGYYFLKLHMEQDPNSMEVELPFQKSMIANHLGMKPETFSRALKKLKSIGIDVDHERISLGDAYSLCHYCDPDTAFSCPKHGTPDCKPGGCN